MTATPPLTDDRPRDFTARMSRRGRAKPISASARNARRGRSALALAAAVAVPAMATPSDWPFGTPDHEARPMAEPMAFETPGESFPGSAFYYMVEEPYAALVDYRSDTPLLANTYTDAEPAPTLPGPVGAAAQPLVAAGSALDRTRALECLTMAIYYEARSEPDAGQRAVAQVVLNRVKHPSYPNSVCGVVFQGSQRQTGCQFSFTCDGSMRRQPAKLWWDRARGVALSALGGAVYRPVGLATHYHTTAIHPYWADSLLRVGTIGAHHFYRFGNAAGQPAAFRSAYVGSEPAARALPRTQPDLANAAPDPLDVVKAYEEAYQRAVTQHQATAGTVGSAPAATPSPAPVYSEAVRARGGEDLYKAQGPAGSGSVRPEYANSGKWLGDPPSGDTR